MDKTIRKYRSLKAMKVDEYRAWQELLPHERLDAVAELSMGAYRMKEPSGMFPPDFKDTLSVFNSRKVRYFPIGGYAVSLYAQPPSTRDLDLLVSPDAGNAKTLLAALAENLERRWKE